MKIQSGPHKLLFVVGVVFAVLVAACGGGDDDDGAANTSTPSSAGATSTPDGGGNGDGENGDNGGDETATPEPTETTEPTATPTSGGGGGGVSPAAAAQFAALMAEFENAEYRVRYETDFESEGDSFQGAMTLYQGGERTRVDFEVDVSGTAFVGSTIATPEKTYFCTAQDDEEVCLEFPAGGSGPFADPGEVITGTVDDFEADADQYSVTTAPGRNIAGQDARCFDIDGPEGTGTVCLSEDGVMLLMELTGPDGMFKFEATEYRLGVTDADFEPPYPVTSLGS